MVMEAVGAVRRRGGSLGSHSSFTDGDTASGQGGMLWHIGARAALVVHARAATADSPQADVRAAAPTATGPLEESAAADVI